MFIYSYCSLWVHTSTPGADCSVMSSGTQGSQCKKRRETREARNHWPITNRSTRRKEETKGGERELAFENARESDKEASIFSRAWQFFFTAPLSLHSGENKSAQIGQKLPKWAAGELIGCSVKRVLTRSQRNVLKRGQRHLQYISLLRLTPLPL